jgi:hypothetical protein
VRGGQRTRQLPCSGRNRNELYALQDIQPLLRSLGVS